MTQRNWLLTLALLAASAGGATAQGDKRFGTAVDRPIRGVKHSHGLNKLRCRRQGLILTRRRLSR